MENTFIMAQAADTAVQTQAVEVVTDTAADVSSFSSSGMMIWILLFVAMWFLLIAPQRKKDKIRRKMLAETKVGDKVITIGGICGVITNKSDKTYILKVSDNAKIEVLISAVNQNITQEEATPVKK